MQHVSAPLPWDDVHLFLTIVRAGSLRAAARELAIDVSTVSRRLSQLEHSSGARLLTRSSRCLAVTPAGAYVLKTGERIALEIAQLGRQIAQSDRRVAGLVRITAPGSLTSVLSDAVREVATSHPGLELELLSQDTLMAVDGQQADVAVRVAGAPGEQLVGGRVGRLTSAIYASATYSRGRRDSRDARSEPWVEWDRRLMVKPAFQWLGERYPERQIVARGLSTMDVHALVRAGVGLGVLPCLMGDADPELRRIEHVPRELATPIWVLTPPELRGVSRVQVMVTAVRRAFKARRHQI